ncbi:MAG: LPP20 family lipoprotein [Endozoicomonadaceae bacterium]|nr:LPP20 family lipoprotein [Endozoicomonadaceae bacterium]
MRILIVLCLCSAFLFACANRSQQLPKWVHSPNKFYSANQYLTSVGEGESIQQAKQQALASLSRIFSVSISETQLDASIFSSVKGRTETKVTRHISLEASNQLRGAEVNKVYVSPEGHVFAIAVLDKIKTAIYLKNEIRLFDTKVNTQLVYATTQSPNFVSTLNALKQAMGDQLKRENLNRDLIVVNDNGLQTDISSGDIEKMIKKSLSILSFDVESKDDFILDSLQSAMTDFGVSVNKQSDVKLVGELLLEPLFKESDWYWLRGTLVLKLVQDGELLSHKHWAMKQSGKQVSVVNSRLYNYVNKHMPDYLVELMTEDVLSRSQ